MEINKQIKDKVNQSHWRAVPYRNGGNANDTFGEIVNDSVANVERLNIMNNKDIWHSGTKKNKKYNSIEKTDSFSFEEVKRIGRGANHYRLDEMYHPLLGELRNSKSYSALAPTNGMKYKDRRVEPDLRPFSIYKPKQGEWQVAKEKHQTPFIHSLHIRHISTPPQIPLPPTCRRQYPVPADTTRFENFSRYWNGRAKGLTYSTPFLYNRKENYNIMEDRRYHRLFWAPTFVPSQPTARHGRQIMLTAY